MAPINAAPPAVAKVPEGNANNVNSAIPAANLWLCIAPAPCAGGQAGPGAREAETHELDQAVQPQRRAHPVRQPAADHAADRHPAEEAGQDGRHGLGRVAEHEHELATTRSRTQTTAPETTEWRDGQRRSSASASVHDQALLIVAVPDRSRYLDALMASLGVGLRLAFWAYGRIWEDALITIAHARAVAGRG